MGMCGRVFESIVDEVLRVSTRVACKCFGVRQQQKGSTAAGSEKEDTVVTESRRLPWMFGHQRGRQQRTPQSETEGMGPGAGALVADCCSADCADGDDVVWSLRRWAKRSRVRYAG